MMSGPWGSKIPRIRVERVTGTAGNVNLTLTPDHGKTGQVHYAQIVLTTDATAANRRVIMSILDPDDNVLIDVHAGATVPANSTGFHLEFMQGIFRETSFIDDALQVPIPMMMIVPPDHKVQITVQNGQAGDSYDVSFCGAEW
jgi:hypothetical protein